MRTVLMICGAKVNGAIPSNRFALRLEWAVEYYRRNHAREDIIFLISSRYSSATADYPLTESEVGKRYIVDALPEATVVKEDISLETIGNYAFSKPIIAALRPGKVIIVYTDTGRARATFMATKIFGQAFDYDFHFVEDELSSDQSMLAKEESALRMAESILAQVPDGDDAAAREVLLYQTPFYFKGVIDDRQFFDQHWPEGFDDFIAKRLARQSKG